MTWQIVAVLGILGVSLVLFVTEKLRMDVVALLVLAVLGVSQLVTMEEALAGFSNPAVVTVWAMFILSAGLSATGIADIISRQVLRVAGTGEVRMIFAIMVTAGGLSAFMNNIGVAALMLPVVMDICRKTGISPSRLLMPMAYASLLGGLTTLIGTPPNLVASTALRQAGEEGFTLFEFAPVGVPALVVGAIFMALVGRHLLPAKMPQEFAETFDEAKGGKGMQFAHSLEERRFRLRVTPGSPLAERSLKESGLAPVLGLSVLAVERRGSVFDDIDGDFELEENDVMTVHGRVDEFREFLNWKAFELASGEEILQLLSRERVGLMSLVLAANSNLVGLEVRETDFHRRFGAHILTIRRGSTLHRDGIGSFKLDVGDRLMVDGRREELEALAGVADFSDVEMLSEEQVSDIYTQTDSLLELVIPPDSSLVGVTIQQTGFSETLHLRVIGIVRKGSSTYFPAADETFRAGDRWLVHGRPATLDLIRAIQTLEVEEGDLLELKVAGKREFAEVTLSPRSGLAGQSLRDVDFRRRYGLQVLSIWRQGRAYRSHLRNMKLEFGDALLLSGKRERVGALVKDADFLVLSQAAYEESGERRSTAKALLATAIMVAVVVPVLMGKLHISIAALAGAAVMVTCRLLSMSEAYRAIEWKSVFLIAGMIPLGTAMQTSGAAEWVAVQVAGITEPFGTIGVVVGLYLITAMATMIVPTTALVLIMAPIALQMAGNDPELSPKLVMMAIAMAASASFTSPISHPANVLVMGPGGYRFIDYVKVGVLLAIVVMITVLPLILWRY